jgi:sugar O-acyltransferase (sialic acid O-acetyltransferase NeuD family)
VKPVVIFGVGDFARVAAEYLAADSPHPVAGFTVHERHLPEGRTLSGRPVTAFETLLETHPPDAYSMFVAVGYSRCNQARAEVYAECRARGYELISYVNSRASVWGETRGGERRIGDNTFIFEENVIQPFATIGSNTVLWSGNHVGHDTKIGDHVFIASHAVISGNCTIGDYTFVGVNATFRDGINVAPRCVIGAAAVIMADTTEGDVYAVRNTELFPKKSWELRSF